jgi:hypothetical protein
MLLRQIYFNEFIKLAFLPVLFFAMTTWFNRPQDIVRTDYLPPPVIIKNMTMGFKYQIADVLWLRALQDFDYCEKKISQNQCAGKGWLFQLLNLVTEIDPVLEPTMYTAAGLALTIIVSDYQGASIIFDKAVKQYRTNWNVQYSAAYHALYEEKNKLKAARLYEAAGKHGAPSWVFALAGRLASDSGADAYSQKILEGMINSKLEQKIIDRLAKRIKDGK